MGIVGDFAMAWILGIGYFSLALVWDFWRAWGQLQSDKALEAIEGAEHFPDDVVEEQQRVEQLVQSGEPDDCTFYDLHKKYIRGTEAFLAANKVSMGVKIGQCLGFLGKNGAGKSTAM